MKVESFRLIGGDIDGLRIPSVETLPEGLTQNLLVRHQGRLKYFDKSKGWSEAIRNSLFPFSSHTFTSASVRGRIGPTLAQCIAAYNGEWVNNEAFFTVRNGYQVWTVPETGTYRIVAVGACGASDNTLDGGGLGASVAGDFQLTAGDQITIVVGQTTGTISRSGGDRQAKPGGGGSFVFASNNFFNLETCLIAAGGGGGIRTQSYPHPVSHASLTTSGNNVATISGNNGKGGVGGLGGYGGTADGSDTGKVNVLIGRFYSGTLHVQSIKAAFIKDGFIYVLTRTSAASYLFKFDLSNKVLVWQKQFQWGSSNLTLGDMLYDGDSPIIVNSIDSDNMAMTKFTNEEEMLDGTADISFIPAPAATQGFNTFVHDGYHQFVAPTLVSASRLAYSPNTRDWNPNADYGRRLHRISGWVNGG